MNKFTFVILLFTVAAHAQWHHAVVKDEMTDERTFFLSTNALGQETKSLATLHLFCPADLPGPEEERPDVVDLTPPKDTHKITFMITTSVVIDQSDGDDILLRFDDQPAVPFSFLVGRGHRSLITGSGTELTVDYLMKAKRLKLQFREYPAQTHVLSFNLIGLKSAMKGHCGF